MTVKTEAATKVAGAPVITNVWWISPSELACDWNAPKPGDSPIDDYQVSVVDANGVATITDTGSGSILEGTAIVNPNGDPWVVKVRAHTLAGWGPWSAAVSVGSGG